MISTVFDLAIYLISFIGIWFGSGLAINAVEKFSKSLKLSSFAISFLLLGFFTSISEMSVGINSIVENDTEIYVGNLIGASIVILLLIVPLLAITGKKVKIGKELQGFNLLFSLVVILVPAIMAIDGKIDQLDSIISALLYLLLVFLIQKKRGLLEKVASLKPIDNQKNTVNIAKIIAGVCIIFIASHFIVEKTIVFATALNVTPFLVSLLVISIGTNIPELSLVVRSAFLKNNQVAFGDYIGSASFNTFLLGVLTLASNRPVYLTNSYLVSLGFLIAGLMLFYVFARSKNELTRVEGCILLLIYCGFLATEILSHL